jgi:hypothetical protein
VLALAATVVAGDSHYRRSANSSNSKAGKSKYEKPTLLQSKIRRVHGNAQEYGRGAARAVPGEDKEFWLDKQNQELGLLQLLHRQQNEANDLAREEKERAARGDVEGPFVKKSNNTMAPSMNKWAFGSGHNSANRFHHQHYSITSDRGSCRNPSRSGSGASKAPSSSKAFVARTRSMVKSTSRQCAAASAGDVD